MPCLVTKQRWVARAYDQQLEAVKGVIRTAATRITLSFDLWMSQTKLALLGLVAHFLDHSGAPRTVLLNLPRENGKHCGHNILEIVAEVIREFDIGSKLGYFVTGNASNNTTYLHFLGEEFGFGSAERHVRCAGHVLNPVAAAVLFWKDLDAFETKLQDLNVEEHELMKWRKKGPAGKLHNVVRYITGSPQRIEAFENIQRRNNTGTEGGIVLKLVKDNVTRWNSFDDCVERAIALRACIDDFIEEERDSWSYFQRRPDLKRHERRYVKGKEPSVLRDQLTSDDWDVVIQYHEILRPSKSATLYLQGQIGGCTGTIWQVLPVFEQLLTHLEEQRRIHRPVELCSLSSEQSYGREHAAPIASSYLMVEHHFSTNINLGWQKLDEYYTKLDQWPIFCAAVVLHPGQKWRWFEDWAGRQEWINQARVSIEQLWRCYRSEGTPDDRPNSPKAVSEQVDEWSDDDENLRSSVDQQAQYYAEPPHDKSLPVNKSPSSSWMEEKSHVAAAVGDGTGCFLRTGDVR
ncbi:hypothetical protein WHR41_09424 [Cladosporium halotolerans]|uniref:Transposase n=1 Tax=Cladosporium halotolerans TaxID=1052096 RepID=A0AB34KCV9_9PEZI